MFFTANLDEKTKILVEALLESTFSKSEEKASFKREDAIANAIRIGSAIAAKSAESFEKAMGNTQASAEITFGIKITSDGAICLAQSSNLGQFQITVKKETHSADGDGQSSPRRERIDRAPSRHELELDDLADDLMNQVGKDIFGSDD